MTAFPIAEKQPKLTERMRQVGKNQRLGHAYLLEGATGVGQAEMAQFMAAMLFCTEVDKPCGECANCQRVLNQEYGDLHWIKPDGETLRIDQMREIKRELSLSAIESENKVFVITEAEKMNQAASNSLLKFLEEPTPGTMVILLTAHLDQILQTIQSRCQIIHFEPLDREMLIQTLVADGIEEQRATLLTALTEDIETAKALDEDEIMAEQRDKAWPWLKRILAGDPRAFIEVTSVWLPLSKERAVNQRLLDILSLYVADLLTLKRGLSETTLFQPSLAANYQQLLAKLTLKRLEQTLHAIAEAKRMISANVSVQSALEYFVLIIWQTNA